MTAGHIDRNPFFTYNMIVAELKRAARDKKELGAMNAASDGPETSVNKRRMHDGAEEIYPD